MYIITTKKWKPRAVALMFLLSSSVCSPRVKHDKQVLDLASQSSIPIAMNNKGVYLLYIAIYNW